MGNTGEVVAQAFNVTRAEQDEYALNSHRKAVAAMKEGRFEAEIVPVEIPQKKGAPLIIRADEGPREDTTLDALAKLKPAFKREGGTVTAGNAPGVNDGAAALVVTSDEVAHKLGRPAVARIVAQATSGVEPKLVMMAPVTAMQMTL
jgi:acetyl-CoA C-acetyltransferase